jgi:hypothetical protein
MVEKTTMAVTGAIHLAYNIGQYSHRKPGNPEGIRRASTNSRRHRPKFSKLNRLIRVITFCRRFNNNCRLPKANRQTATLSTQELDQARTCCVKMVQQISYAQEMKN